MKKIKFLIFFVLLFAFNINVKANTLYSIDINANLDEDGTLHVEEVWSMKTTKDTEIYKEEYNLGNMEITNFKVQDENRIYTENPSWNIYSNFEEKKYKYGINNSSSGIELCWGISEYGNKTYTINYDIENAVFNTDDSQVLYLKLINDLSFPPQDFSIVISGYENFEDTLDVWGYGYEGYSYVDNGKIFLSNKENTSLKEGEYVVLLVKFDKNTFNVPLSNAYSNYETFNDVLNSAEDGSHEYEDNDGKYYFFFFLGSVGLFFLLGCIGISQRKYKFGPAGSKIKLKDINAYRDIPCDKNIFKGFFLSIVYSLNKNNTDFIGAILLKWLYEDKIGIFKTVDKKSKEVLCIDLTKYNGTNVIEKELYEIMYDASDKGILKENEFKNYAKNKYKTIYDWLDKAEMFGCNLYIDKNLVTQQKNKHYLIDDNLKNEAIEVAGLKKYLQDFAYMDKKQPIEVKLWKEYLIFAQIFGIASTVAKQFKNLYPEVLTEMQDYNFDMTDIILLNAFSNAISTSTSAAKSAAEYSAGGGGFSSGGGGGGSFGGGGGGSR